MTNGKLNGANYLYDLKVESQDINRKANMSIPKLKSG